jgi:predicted Fe-Mo cluster-binding NifX family protein
MRIAIPVWKDRVSPVFDVARHLLLIDIENSTIVARKRTTVDEADLASRARHVMDLGVQVLICGAISRPLRLILEAKGLDVIELVCGKLEEILEAFLRGGLNDQSFLMPGCRVRPQDFQPTSSATRDGLKAKGRAVQVAITSQGPELTSKVDPRFGRARYLIIADTETYDFVVADNARNLNTLQGAGIQTAKRLVDEAVDTVITGQVGPKAMEALQIAGVEVFLGVSGTVEDALRQFKSRSVSPLFAAQCAPKPVEGPGTQ